jgi:hypothetical protein
MVAAHGFAPRRDDPRAGFRAIPRVQHGKLAGIERHKMTLPTELLNLNIESVVASVALSHADEIGAALAGHAAKEGRAA